MVAIRFFGNRYVYRTANRWRGSSPVGFLNWTRKLSAVQSFLFFDPPQICIVDVEKCEVEFLLSILCTANHDQSSCIYKAGTYTKSMQQHGHFFVNFRNSVSWEYSAMKLGHLKRIHRMQFMIRMYIYHVNDAPALIKNLTYSHLQFEEYIITFFLPFFYMNRQSSSPRTQITNFNFFTPGPKLSLICVFFSVFL